MDHYEKALRNKEMYDDTRATQIPQDNCGQAVASGLNPHYQRPSLCEEAEKSAYHHQEQADKNLQAVIFFRENPAFDKFIQLIRSGAIQI